MLPSKKDIDEILSYYPKLFEDESIELVTWPSVWPDYHPIVSEFFHKLSAECWSDYDYDPEAAVKMIHDEVFINSAELDNIKTLLTFCVRRERFCDGYWETLLTNGILQRLLSRLREIRSEMA